MKVGIHIQSANDEKYAAMLRRFANSIEHLGGSAYVNEHSYVAKDYDVDVFFGSWKQRENPWHICKQQIVQNHQLSGRPFVVFETPLVGRGPVSDIMQDECYRVGINGFLADDGFEHVLGSPHDRLDVQCITLPQLKINESGCILVALQIPGDASLRGCNISLWARDTISEIKKYSTKPIILRTPQLPRDYDLSWLTEDIILQQGSHDNLYSTIDSAWCTVTYSSGLAIDSMLRGVPTIACNSANFTYRFGQNDIANVTSPSWPDEISLRQWLADLSYAQWSDEEIANGECWNYIRSKLINKLATRHS